MHDPVAGGVMPTLAGAAVGTGLAALVAGSAWRAGSLSRSGAMAALVIGSLAMTAGRGWGLFLVVWFVTASVASRVGRHTKETATGDVVAKGGRRDAAQVVANGGVFALCALSNFAFDTPALALAGAAALVAAGADTLATETGTLWRGQPWSLRTFAPVPSGTSGAVSLAGTVGMTAGAVLLALSAAVCGLIDPSDVTVVALAGVAGAVADTVIGAFWQLRRWCPACQRETEQAVHRCGKPTQAWRGVPWLNNDVVNFVCTVTGAVLVAGVRIVS
ncbi:DUF92 domain-containing protein [Gemmatimonas sp.]|uniref:DUF92 domain-containing protein n=1 Tax=Gemmatimonas sp. TaxID=1962908 RepID=UPI0027BADAE0|nr:DUF92 domain-containing protein [Gemmatimonas sp.]